MLDAKALDCLPGGVQKTQQDKNDIKEGKRVGTLAWDSGLGIGKEEASGEVACVDMKRGFKNGVRRTKARLRAQGTALPHGSVS